jgi:predicted transcriptional regulator
MSEKPEITAVTANIVSAYVGANSLQAGDLPALIRSIHTTLGGLSGIPEEAPAPPQPPAVSIRKSVTPDYLICLEDGRRFKSLKRHLRSKFGLSPEQYRAKWGLPKDYPMVAPNYAAARSAMAKASGLGLARRQPAKSKPKAPARAKKA